MAVENEVYDDVEQALDIFVLGVLKKECQVVYALIFEPVLAIITRTVHYGFYLILLQHVPRFGHTLSRYIHSFHDLTTLLFEFLHL